MNILGMGPMELLLIIVLALIVFGPAKLPEIMGQVGKAINDFRRATSELSDEFNKTIQAELQEGRAVLDETKTAVSSVHTTVNSAIVGVPAPTRVASPTEPTAPIAADAPTNGTAPQPYVDGYPETRLSNGTAPEPGTPPLADTSNWSWETSPAPSAPPPGAQPAIGEPTAPASASPPTVAPPQEVAGEAPSGGGAAAPHAQSRPPAARDNTPRDELLPPY